MSKLYHQLLSSIDQPMAILQCDGYLLLEFNDLFAEACNYKPSIGGTLLDCGFSREMEDVIDKQCQLLAHSSEGTKAPWVAADRNCSAKKSEHLQYHVHYVEPETGHLIIALSYSSQ